MPRISRLLFDRMCDHAREGGEHEVCGVLVGEPAQGIIRQAVAGKNVATDRARYFTLDAATLLRVDHEARAAGWEIMGFYHTHPHHPPVPSPTDRALMWPAFPTLILTVSSRGVAVCGWEQRGSILRPCFLQIED